jgi:hypothetical protein
MGGPGEGIVYEMNDFLVLQFSLNTLCCSHLVSINH